MGFFRDLGGIHLLIILLIIIVLFGASRLPAVSKGIAQSVRIFRREVKGDKEDETGDAAGSSTSKTTSDDKK